MPSGIGTHAAHDAIDHVGKLLACQLRIGIGSATAFCAAFARIPACVTFPVAEIRKAFLQMQAGTGSRSSVPTPHSERYFSHVISFRHPDHVLAVDVPIAGGCAITGRTIPDPPAALNAESQKAAALLPTARPPRPDGSAFTLSTAAWIRIDAEISADERV